MRSGFSIGRIFGIRVFIDWSWLLIFVLVTWNLAGALFPSIHPEWSLGLRLAMGVLASLLFFASVLAHELAHSLVAKARGLPVRRITLFIFGGVSNIEREPDNPLSEFLVAVVGPLTSLALGALFLFLGRASLADLPFAGNLGNFFSSLDPLTTLLLWLGPVNIILGIFNLIPGFPLDGGRVLRSLLWAITNNLRRATRWATLVGQAIAWLFILAGIAMIFGIRIPFFGTGFVGGLWLAFIGWFLNNAAAQSYQQVMVEDMLEGVRVNRLMKPSVPAVPPSARVSDLVDHYVMGSDERAFPVVQDGRLVGLVCLEDIRKVPRSDWDAASVLSIMTPADQLDVVTPQEDASDALQKLARRDVSQMPVVQDGRLVGMLSRRDILRWLQIQSEMTPG